MKRKIPSASPEVWVDLIAERQSGAATPLSCRAEKKTAADAEGQKQLGLRAALLPAAVSEKHTNASDKTGRIASYLSHF